MRDRIIVVWIGFGMAKHPRSFGRFIDHNSFHDRIHSAECFLRECDLDLLQNKKYLQCN